MKPSLPTTHRWLLAAFALVAFLGCLAMLRVSGMYVSPDETANAFFSHRFAQTGTLSAFEPLNPALDDALHPRSVLSIAGHLVPGSFLGLPVLYGSVAAVFGEWSIPFWTPALAALAAFAWYGIVRRLFDREVALLSAALLAIHPAWWYYSARSLMHNVPFVALLIFSTYFVVARPFATRPFATRPFATRPFATRRRAFADFVAAGLCLGLALFVRTSEAVWILPSVTALLVVFRSRFTVRQIALFVAAMAIALVPMFAFNRATYGAALATGYTVEREAEQVSSPSSQPLQPSTPSQPSLFFPFGLFPRTALQNVSDYALTIFWWMSALALVGFPLAMPNRSVPPEGRLARRAYILLAGGVTLYLGLLYGSWTFFDNPDPSQVTIGNSHVRYWLPAFVLSTPFAALAIRWISRRAMTEAMRRAIAAALVAACLALSVHVVFFSSQDGIVPASAGLAAAREVRSAVVAQTEREAVIIVDRSDKLFFPYRRVLYPLRDEKTYALMPRIILRAPLYYYGITFPDADVAWLNAEKLAGLGLRIDAMETFGIETLYRITKKEN